MAAAAATTEVPLVCQVCDGKGHAARECPTRKRVRAAAESCQLCGVLGHTAKDCPNPDAADGAGAAALLRPSIEADADSDAPSEAESCTLCPVGADEPCKTADCPMAVARQEALDEVEEWRQRCAKRRRHATDPPTTTPANAAAAASATADPGTGAPKPDTILKMPPRTLVEQDLKHIIMLPPTWTQWVWAALPAQRTERHRRLIDGLKQVLGAEKPLKAGSLVTEADQKRLVVTLNRISTLLDPAKGPLDAAHRPRIADVVKTDGMEAVAYRDAKIHGWAVVRAALQVYEADSQTDKQWNAALRVAQQRNSSSTSSTTPGRGTGTGRASRASKGPKGGGKGGSKGGRGGGGGTDE